jgi:hypothetical protein
MIIPGYGDAVAICDVVSPLSRITTARPSAAAWLVISLRWWFISGCFLPHLGFRENPYKVEFVHELMPSVIDAKA